MRQILGAVALALVGFALLGVTLCAQTRNGAGRADSPDFFETKIRPILADNCYNCHAASALGGLRLDSRDAMLKGGGRGTAIVAGDADKSLLIQAIRQTDEKLKMPMGGKLKDSEIADLAAWVKAGAVWPATLPVPGAATGTASATAASKSASSPGKYTITAEQRNFWSFQTLKSPQPPAVKDTALAKLAKTDIDRFVLSKLEQQGLKPVRLATKRELIRRASLDLTGLPPTPEEVDAFEKDESAGAFAKVVDRLLASPHYGERWGRFWLDIARYGEDDYRSLDPQRRGYNPYPNAYVYRDWVIQAFNDDMPYPQFVKAQIAGDLMDETARFKTLPATGFLGLGPWYYDNGAVEVTRADERHDRVDAVTRGFLGLTAACARCHDHKYDPIPTADYYALAGVFASTAYHEYPLAPASVVAEYATVEKEIERKQKVLGEMQEKWSEQLAESLAFESAKYIMAAWEVTGDQKKELATVVEEKKLDYEMLDRWIRYLGRESKFYPYLKPWQEMMKAGGGSKANQKTAQKLADELQKKIIEVTLTHRDLEEQNEIIENKALPGTEKKKRANKPNEFVTNDDFCPGCGLELKSMKFEDSSFWTELFQRELDGADPDVQPGARTKPGLFLYRGWGLEHRLGADVQAVMARVRSDIDAERKKLDPHYPFLHGVADNEHPVNQPLAIRGNAYNPGPEIPRHFLSVLSAGDPQPFAKGSGRLELADSILTQPITMRVIVNRIWKQHFGTGIVDTPSNFGITGERPTNPELLEYLASSFAHDGMSIKQLHRKIMLSAVYQWSTDLDQSNFAKDSGNRYYWRANPRRMDAEQLRDSVLAVAGNLDDSLGGPSADLTPAYTRRTVYGKVSRYKLDEYLQLFDFPSPAISAEKRFSTTVPLQRLFLMNSDFMQIEAEELVKRVAAEPDNASRIKKMYRIVLNREPTAEELKIAIAYIHSEPMKEYEEAKNRPAPGGRGDGRGRGGIDGDGAPAAKAESQTPDPKRGAVDGKAVPDEGAAADESSEMGMGMMMGVPGKGRGGRVAVPEYSATPLGRFAKVLLSSSEFVFID
jgi:cytochrome c553/mono/diheme cytochrome c family protein